MRGQALLQGPYQGPPQWQWDDGGIAEPHSGVPTATCLTRGTPSTSKGLCEQRRGAGAVGAMHCFLPAGRVSCAMLVAVSIFEALLPFFFFFKAHFISSLGKIKYANDEIN